MNPWTFGRGQRVIITAGFGAIFGAIITEGHASGFRVVGVLATAGLGAWSGWRATP